MLKVENIHMTYGNRTILDNVSLEFGEKKIISLTGKSGAGKSTLLGVISGLLKPDKGTVYYNDQDIFKWSDMKRSRFRNRSMGFVFQFFNLFPDMTAYQNILYPTSLNPHASKDVKKDINELVELLKIGHIINQFPTTLSGGERQRVAIARAVINNPQIILADEPTGNLDEDTTKDIIDLFITLKKERGITTILATHEHEVVESSDIVYSIGDGDIEKISKTAKTTAKSSKVDGITVKKVSKKTTTKKTASKTSASSSKKKTSAKAAKKKSASKAASKKKSK